MAGEAHLLEAAAGLLEAGALRESGGEEIDKDRRSGECRGRLAEADQRQQTSDSERPPHWAEGRMERAQETRHHGTKEKEKKRDGKEKDRSQETSNSG